MKVLLVIPYISLVYGGTGKVVSEVAHALGKSGVHIDVVSTNADDKGKLQVPLKTWIQESNYRIQYFPCWHRYDQTFSFSWAYWMYKHLKDYDVIHTHTLFSPMLSLTYKLCQLKKVPYIMTPHGMLEPWALQKQAQKKALYLKLLDKPALRKAAAIQTLTEPERQQVTKLNFSNVFRVSNGIHPEIFKNLPSKTNFHTEFPETNEKHIILFLSRIDPKKGLDLLVQAFAKTHLAYPNTHLVVAGPDSIGYLADVKNMFARVNCLDSVTFTGNLEGDRKYAALSAASLYILPSYSEGFSMSILEGMAAGLPCIITKACNFSEAEKKGAAYITQCDTEEIGEILMHCCQNHEEAKSIGEKAKTLILNHYTWENIAAQLIQQYSQLI